MAEIRIVSDPSLVMEWERRLLGKDFPGYVSTVVWLELIRKTDPTSRRSLTYEIECKKRGIKIYPLQVVISVD